jgi:tRNA G18 (ribose-2'-O)-methylase SpoU
MTHASVALIPNLHADGMESLNVGVAGSVLMYALSHPQHL